MPYCCGLKLRLTGIYSLDKEEEAGNPSGISFGGSKELGEWMEMYLPFSRTASALKLAIATARSPGKKKFKSL
jgi:hypothetical protein